MFWRHKKARLGRSLETVAVSNRIARAIAAATIALPLFAAERAAAQVVRDPQTPYHFLRYEDVPSDRQNPAWPNDFWAPLKFIPLDIAPRSYINFGGEDRERVEHFSNPFFGLTPRGLQLKDSLYELGRWGIPLMADGPAPDDGPRPPRPRGT